MERLLAQKFGKVLLIGLAGLLVVVLLSFFVRVLIAQRPGNITAVSDEMMLGQPVPFQDDLGMMGGIVQRGVPDGATAVPGQKMVVENEAPIPDAGKSAAATFAQEEKKVMKNGTLNVRVRSADETARRIREIATEFGGSITESDFSQGTDNMKRGSVTVKVPVARFDEAFAALKQVATLVENENMAGSDVTAQYIDLAARLKNKKAQETALQNILNRAEKVSDIIDITNELGTVRGEIESLEGQLRYLDARTDMASITIFITEDSRVAGDRSFRPGQTIAESLKTLLAGLGHFVTGIITFTIIGVPMMAVYGLILWGIFFVVRTLMRKFWR